MLLLMIWSCNTQKNLVSEKSQKDSIRIDTIHDFKEIIKTEPTQNEFSLKCDSSSFNQSFKSGAVQYRIVKEKGGVKVTFKTDTITKIVHDKYKNSLQRVATKSEILKTSLQKPSFWQALFSNIWKILFWTIFVLWFFNITPIKILKL